MLEDTSDAVHTISPRGIHSLPCRLVGQEFPLAPRCPRSLLPLGYLKISRKGRSSLITFLIISDHLSPRECVNMQTGSFNRPGKNLIANVSVKLPRLRTRSE